MILSSLTENDHAPQHSLVSLWLCMTLGNEFLTAVRVHTGLGNLIELKQDTKWNCMRSADDSAPYNILVGGKNHKY